MGARVRVLWVVIEPDSSRGASIALGDSVSLHRQVLGRCSMRLWGITTILNNVTLLGTKS